MYHKKWYHAFTRGTPQEVIKENWLKYIQYIAFLILAVGLGIFIAFYPYLAPAVLLGLVTFIFVLMNFHFGMVLVILSILAGQLIRIPLPIGERGALVASDVIIPMVLIGWFLSKLKKGFKFKKTPLNIPILIFIFIAFISLINSIRFWSTSEVLVGSFYLLRWVEYVFIFFIAVDIIKNKKQAVGYVKLLLLVGLAIAVLGLLQLIFMPSFETMAEFGWDPHIGRVLSVFFDPNFTGGFLTVILSVVIGIFIFTKSKKNKYFLLFLSLPIFLAIIFTFSRSTYLALGVVFFTIGILKYRRLLFLSILISIILFLNIPRIQQRVMGGLEIDPTAQARIKSWQDAVEIIADYPLLGIGYNTYQYAQVKYGTIKDIKGEHSIAGSDSSLLTIWATCGILGFLAYLWIYGQILFQSWKTWRNKKFSSNFRGFSLGLFSGVLALLAHSQFANSLLYPYIMGLVWILASILMVMLKFELDVHWEKNKA